MTSACTSVIMLSQAFTLRCDTIVENDIPKPDKSWLEKRIIGRSMTDEEYEHLIPSDSFVEDILHRDLIADYTLSLESLARFGPEDINQSLRDSLLILYELGEARRVIFQDAQPRTYPELTPIAEPSDASRLRQALQAHLPAPPFNTLKDAWSWINSELESDEAIRTRQDADWVRVIRFTLGEYTAYNQPLVQSIPWAIDNPMLEGIRPRVPFYYSGLESEATKFRLQRDEKDDWVHPEWEDAIKWRNTPLFGWPGVGDVSHLFDEGEVEAVTEKLALLAVWGGWLAFCTGYSWRRSDCVRLILTDMNPELPRIRIWKTAAGTFVAIHGQFKWEVSKELFHKVQKFAQAMGSHEQPLTPEDVNFIMFGRETKGMTASQRLVEWNERYPEQQLNTRQTLDSKIRRALVRLKREKERQRGRIS
jgi:hypothetical protein